MLGTWKRRMMILGLVAALGGGLTLATGATSAWADEPIRAADPSGANTGGIGDIAAATPGKPTLEEIGAAAGHNQVSINLTWTLLTGFLVMFMQAGFALAEAGFTRAKNVAHTMMMNFMVYGIGMTGFWIMGYAIMFGGFGALGTMGGTNVLDHMVSITIAGKTFGLFGAKGFFLSGQTYDVAIFALFLFQMVFMDTAATIPTGAMAERWSFKSFFIYGFFISMISYPIFGAWVWGGGWLAQLGTNFGLGHGYIDFAGSSVVHMVGGVTGLAGAMVLGPRIGKYNKDGTANAIPGHNIPMALLGCFILAFGWFGFNPGSTLAGSDLRIAVIAVNTMLASASGAIFAVLYMWFRYGKPDPSMAGNGMLAGLVAITAPCAFVNSFWAFVIGAIAGVLVCWSVFFIERRLKIDDPVGAVSVHGTCGAWGVISLGLFADGTYGSGWGGVNGTVKGLLYGDASQFVAQLIGPIVCFVFIFSISWVFFKILDAAVGLRSTPEAEIEGLDVPEMGIHGYPEIQGPPNLVPSMLAAGGASPKPAVPFGAGLARPDAG
jgi:Amt family ammonium transporter